MLPSVPPTRIDWRCRKPEGGAGRHDQGRARQHDKANGCEEKAERQSGPGAKLTQPLKPFDDVVCHVHSAESQLFGSMRS